MNLLLTGCFNYTESQKEKLASLGYRIHFMQQEIDILPRAASEVDATVCNGLFLTHHIEDFSRLKFIQLTSAGFDRVPVDYIKAKGIMLHNARGVYSVPMAEWALFRVLEHYKQGWFFIEPTFSLLLPLIFFHFGKEPLAKLKILNRVPFNHWWQPWVLGTIYSHCPN